MFGRCLLAVALLAVPVSSAALPLYAARENKACNHCHLDPGGGGARNSRGQYYESHDHSFDGFVEVDASAAGGEAASPLESLLKALSFSGDLRVLYSMSEGPHLSGGTSCESCHARGQRAPDQTFFVMQGELAVTARISDQVAFTYSNDLGITRDAFAVLRLGESGAYVKAGVFEVPFGIEEQRDHNTLIKVRHDIGSNLRDVGVQIAVQKPRHFVSLAILNGGSRFPDSAPVLTSSYDQNGSPAVVARGGVLGSRFRFGGSVMFDDSLAASRPRQVVGGVFGSVFGDRWRVSGEFDVGRAKLAGSETSNIGFFAEGIWSLCRALDVGAKVDWYDPDTDFDADAETWYTAMVEHHISRNASVEARLRFREEETSASVGEVPNDDGLVMLNIHF